MKQAQCSFYIPSHPADSIVIMIKFPFEAPLKEGVTFYNILAFMEKLFSPSVHPPPPPPQAGEPPVVGCLLLEVIGL